MANAAKGIDPKQDLQVQIQIAEERTAEKQAEYDEAQEQDRLLRERNQQFADKLANWQAQGDQQLTDQLIAAWVQDAMENRNRTSQVIGGAAGLRDSIQGSIRRDNTHVEQLATLKRVEAGIKKSVEQLQNIARNVGGPARFS